MTRHRRRVAVTLVAFIGAISAALGGFFGGRFLQHHVDLGDGSDWSYLNDTLSLAVWLSILAFICGVLFLVLVWWKVRANDGRFA